MAGVVEVTICGRVSVTCAGQPRETLLRGAQGRSLLAFLVLNRHRPVSRDELAEAVWDDAQPAAAGTALRALLSRVRSAVDPGRVEGSDRLVLRLPDAARVDLDEAESDLVRAGQAQAAQQPDLAVEAAARALLVLDQGPGLDDDRDWVRTWHEKLRGQRLRAMHVLAEASLELGPSGLATAERVARLVVAEDPYRESAHVLLMRALEQGGDTAGGLQVYDSLRRRLRDELGISPSVIAQAEHQRLLQQRPREFRPQPLSSLLTSAGAGSLVGRVDVLARLQALLPQRGRSVRRVAVVRGEPGIGKTRLVAELARAAADAGVSVLYGRCSEQPGAPYRPVAEALQPLLEQEACGADVPALRDVLSGRTPPDTSQDREVFFQALASRLTDAARAHPLLLVLDDLHWADAGTLRALARLAELRLPLLVVVTTRPQPPDQVVGVLAELQRTGDCTSIELEGLARDDIGRLAGTVLHTDPPAALIDAVHARTEGNPFFALQLIRSADGESMVPGGVRDVVAARAAGLAASSRDVLDVAAVLGQEVDVALLERAAGVPARIVAEALEAAVEIFLLRREGDGYRFVHALVQETLQELLGPARRRALHARVAAALEVDEPRAGDVRRLAHHYALSSRDRASEAAVRWGIRAIELSLAALAWEDAATQAAALDTALRRADGTATARTSVLLLLARSLVAAGRTEESTTVAREAALVARRSGQDDAFAQAALLYAEAVGDWVVPDSRWRVEEREVLLADALERLGDGPPSALRARVAARLALELAYSTEVERRVELGRAAVADARAIGDDGALAAALNGLHSAMYAPDNAADRLAVADEQVEAAARAQDEVLELRGHFWRFLDALELGQVQVASRAAAVLGYRADETRRPLARWWQLRAQAGVLLLAGQDEEGVTVAEQVRELGEQLQHPNTEMVHSALLNGMHLHTGQVPQERIKSSRRMAVQFADTVPGWQVNLARLLCEAGQLDEACAELQLVRPLHELPRDINYLQTVFMLAEAAAMTGDVNRAREVRSVLLAHRERWPVVGHVGTVFPPMVVALAQVDALLGEAAAAVAELEQGLQLLDSAGAVSWSHRVRLLLAQALQQSGDAAAARAVATAVVEGATRTGHGVIAARARALLAG